MNYAEARAAVAWGLRQGLVIAPAKPARNPRAKWAENEDGKSERRKAALAKGHCPNHPAKQLPLVPGRTVCAACYTKKRDYEAAHTTEALRRKAAERATARRETAS